MSVDLHISINIRLIETSSSGCGNPRRPSQWCTRKFSVAWKVSRRVSSLWKSERRGVKLSCGCAMKTQTQSCRDFFLVRTLAIAIGSNFVFYHCYWNCISLRLSLSARHAMLGVVVAEARPISETNTMFARRRLNSSANERTLPTPALVPAFFRVALDDALYPPTAYGAP